MGGTSRNRSVMAGVVDAAVATLAVAVLAVTVGVLLPAPDAVLAQAPTEPAAEPPTKPAATESVTGPARATRALDDPNCRLIYGLDGQPISGRCTYNAVDNTYQFFRPPADVGLVRVVAYGAQGGNGVSAGGGTPALGGLGGRISADIDVSGNRALTLQVGNQGQPGQTGGRGGLGGWPSGGDGGASTAASAAGCGGGGATRILDGPTPLLEAGGGGGCGGYFAPFQGAVGGRGGVQPGGGAGGESSGPFCTVLNGHAGSGGGGATAAGGGLKGVQGQYVDGSGACMGGTSSSAAPGRAVFGGYGSAGEGNPTRGPGGGGGGGGTFGGGGGGGGQQLSGIGSGGGGGGGGGLSSGSGRGVRVTAHADGVRSGHGTVEIHWDHVPTTIELSTAGNVSSIKAGNDVTFVATLISRSEVTGHSGGVVFTDLASGTPLCEGTPQVPVLQYRDGSNTVSRASCTMTLRPTDPPPPQCVPATSPDGPPPPLPAACSFTTSTAKFLAVSASYSAGNATSAATASRPLPFTIAPGEVYSRVLGSPEPGMVRIMVAPTFMTVPIDGKATLFYEDDTPVEGCIDVELVYLPEEWLGLVSCHVPMVPGTTRTLHAFYTGGPFTESVRSLPDHDFVYTAAKVATTTDLTVVDGPRTYGNPLIARAEVALTPATLGVDLDGTVTFTDALDGGTRAPVPGCVRLPLRAADDGRVDCTVARPSAGTHRLQAEYEAGNQTAGSISVERSVTVTTATPRVSLTADPPGGSTAGQVVALTARVVISDSTSDNVAVLEGTATFRDRGVGIPGCVGLPVDQPTVTCRLQPTVTTGSAPHSFTVHHAGSTNLAAASSAPLSYAVGLASTTTELSLVSPASSPVPAGTAVTVAATVTASVAGVTPTGAVAFFDNGQPIAACPPPRNLDGAGRATCTFVPAAGTTRALTAQYLPGADALTAASSTRSAFEVAVGRFASSIALVAAPPTPTVGDDVVMSATVTAAAGAPAPTGRVMFLDDGSFVAGCESVPLTPIGGSSPAAARASCTVQPGAGAHPFRASYIGDTATAPSTSAPAEATVSAVGTRTSVSVTPATATALTLVATVAPVTGRAVPRGTVDLTVDGTPASDACRNVPLVVSASGVSASCSWNGDPTKGHAVVAAFTPASGDFLASTGSATYAPGAQCWPREVALWAALDDTPSGVVVRDLANRLTLSVVEGPGPCGVEPVPFTATSISLFGGLLTGNGSGVLTGGGADGSLCLTEGSFRAPEWMNLPRASVSAPICWMLDDEGGLGATTRGELTVEGPEGSFPFVDLADAPETSASFAFTAGGPDGAGELQVRLVAGPVDAPVLVLGLTVAADGDFVGSFDAPGLVLFGRAVALHAEISGGADAPVRVAGEVTVGPIEIAEGVVIDEATVGLSPDGLTVDGVASIGVGDEVLRLAVSGAVADSRNWSLDLRALDTATWEPLPGLAITPNLAGSISSVDGEHAFTIEGGDPDGSPLVEWQPAPGASVALRTIELSSDGAGCAAGDLVLAFTGEVSFSGTEVAVDGCIDLSLGSYRLAATASEIEVSDDLVVSGLALTADGAVGAGLDLEGGGDATIAGRDLHVRFALATSGALVVGASVDLTSWGVPAQGFVAYASSEVEGFDTGDPEVGDDGVVDLDAGLTAEARWTPEGETAELLSSPAPDGLGLAAGGGIRFTAQIGSGSLVFHGEVEAPDGLPFLTLPGGTTVDEAALTFARVDGATTLALHVAATVQPATAVVIDLELGLTDGSVTGEVDVTDLALFGRDDIALNGTIVRAPDDDGVMTVEAAVRGSVGSEDDPVEVAPSVSFTRLDLALGTAGIAVEGDVVIADQAGLTVEGRVFTEADDDAGFGAGGWRLAVSTDDAVEWSPTDGVTFTADLSGSIEKRSSVAPVSFRLEAEGPDDGALFTFTPSDAPVTVAVERIAVANATPAPRACSARPGDVWLSIDGSFTATIGDRDGTATASGCFNVTSGATSIAADLSDLRVDLGGGVTVRGPRFTVARAGSTPAPAPGSSRYSVTAEVAVDLEILGSPYSSPEPGSTSARLTAQLSYKGRAVVVGVRGNFGRYGLGGVGADAYLYVASAAVTGFETGDPALSKVDPKTGATTPGRIDLVKGINVAARVTLPGSVTSGLSQIGDGDDAVAAPTGAVTALGQIDAAARAFTFRVQFRSGVDGQELLTTANGTRLTLDEGFLKFTVRSGQVSFGLGVAGTLHLPAVEDGGTASKVPLTGELTVSTTGITASLQLGTCGSPEQAWRNAFGIAGLTVECAAIQGGVSFAGVPTVGFFGKVTSLPTDLADAIGYVKGAPMQFAFNLNPMMLSISIGEKDSKAVALRPLQAMGKPDFIQVRYATLYAAPAPVTIGQQSFPAGFGIGFQASIAGVDMNILASVDPSTPSISMLAQVSEIKIGALTLGPVMVDLHASPTDFRFIVEGTLRLGPGSAEVGPALKIGGELSVSVRVSILPSGFEAHVWGRAAMQLAALVPQEVCWYGGQVPIPCNFTWESTGFDVTIPRTGIAVDGQGISLLAAGYRVTLLWEGGLTAGSSAAASPSVDAPSTRALVGSRADDEVIEDPADPVDDPTEPDPELTVAELEASEEPMAEAPLPAELVIPAAELLPGESVLAPPSGPNPAGDLPVREVTTEIVIDPEPVPELRAGTAPGEWTATGALRDARANAAIATLPDGRVLVAGGSGAAGPLATAEIYDPVAGTWTPTGSLTTARSGASVAVLPDGRVLVAGGTAATEGAPGAQALASAEVFDPATQRWSAAASLGTARSHATTTTLADGSVLVAGGFGPDGSLASAERYDPASGEWRSVSSMATARGLASAARLADGRVLVAGGLGTTTAIASAEVFDPATDTWLSVADMPSASMLDTATALTDGRILVAGGDARGKVYDPAADAWSWTGGLGTVRSQATAVRLADGTVLLIGGSAAGTLETDAEIYDPATNAWQVTTDLPRGTASASAVVLADGSVLAVGGIDDTTPLANTAIYRKTDSLVAPEPVPAPVRAPVVERADRGDLPVTGSDLATAVLLALALLAAGTTLKSKTRRNPVRR